MLRACVSLPCPVSSSLGIQGSLCEIFLQDKGQDIESVHCEKRVCVCVCQRFLILTLLWPRVLLLYLLDKQVKHLRLDEFLDKVSSGLGLNCLVETSLFKHSGLSSTAVFHIRGIVANCFHKEMQEGFRYYPVQLLHR